MGWLYKCGCSRRDLIAERTEAWRDHEADLPSNHCLSRLDNK
jgi:hypothetical protein